MEKRGSQTVSFAYSARPLPASQCRNTETKSDTAHRVNEWRTSAVYLSAQSPHVHVNCVIHRIQMQIPNPLQQHCSRYDPPRVPREIFEKFELLWTQFNLSPAPT